MSEEKNVMEKEAAMTDEELKAAGEEIADLLMGADITDEQRIEVFNRALKVTVHKRNAVYVAPALIEISKEKDSDLQNLSNLLYLLKYMPQEAKQDFVEWYTESQSPDYKMSDAPFIYGCLSAFALTAIAMKNTFEEIRTNKNEVLRSISAEAYVNESLSDEKLQKIINETAQIYSGARNKKIEELREQTINSQQFITQLKAYIEKNNAELKENDIAVRGNIERGVYELCQEYDYDYAFDTNDKGEYIEKGNYFINLLDTYSEMERDDNSDSIVETLCFLLPKIYVSSDSLISLHSNPEKARRIYADALNNRASTKPAVPLLTKDVIPNDKETETDTDINTNINTDPHTYIPPKRNPGGNIPKVSPKSGKVALLLCLFLGWSGAHNFYLGKKLKGVAYLFTLGLLGTGILKDLKDIILGTAEDSNHMNVVL